ncbi:SUKH-3 domain-containing protein [Phytohabitans sp. ZYX-F-186]|uniref:SUKH-3 domain-containing protein n=1 Tax=Phytohabitans maris TaxID=3071409 RepID=A0ABU0ZPD7_9ACTN|nr:SUKH-3 domain-containing protein [Phytohabitans sp. ZYX-F-186]MDQ7907792.1 SUKH-3 domain-containing protein [Phytohabitans sp. ZYX-F-186]
MAERFTPPVENALRAAGWYPGRRLPDEELAGLRRAVFARTGVFGGRLRPSVHADRALAEFGGLVVDAGRPGVDLNPRPFALDPALAAASVETLIDAGRALGASLFPIGVEGMDEAVLAIADHGEVLAIDAVGEWSLGATLEAALDTLVTGGQPSPAKPVHERRPDWEPPAPEQLAESAGTPPWPLKRPIGAAFYLPRSPASLHYVWLPDTLTRIGITPAADPASPGSFYADWGGQGCVVRAFDLGSLTVLLLAFELYAFQDQLDAARGQSGAGTDAAPPVARAFSAACAGLSPDLEVAFLHSRRTPDLLEAAVEHEYHVVTMDGESLLDAGFAALYLNGETDYAIAPALAREPREELPILGGNIYLHGSGEQRWG